MKIVLIRLLLVVFALPLFFACNTSREFASFSPSGGAYHKAKLKAQAKSENSEVVTASKPAETPVSVVVEANTMAAASETAQPVTEFATVENRLQQASAEADLQRQVAATATTNAQQKLTFAQKLLLKKALKMASKATGEKQVDKLQKPGAVNKTMLDQNLKLALVFLIAALIASLFGSLGALIGLILLIIALVFLILWVLSL